MAKNSKGMKIGILTAGGDCPGLNAAIRGVGKTAILQYGMHVMGISSGFLGLIHNDVQDLSEAQLSGILTVGGTILGTSREKPFKSKNEEAYIQSKPEIIKKNYKLLGLDCLVCIGGNGTMKTASRLAKNGMNVIGLPKTIDNDVWGTDQTFGFDSAVQIATEALDRLHTTANSHKRIMVIELMGHNAGWLTLYAGLAGGGDVILLPEIKYDPEVIFAYLEKRAVARKPYSIIVVAEGIVVPEKKAGKKKHKKNIAAGTAIARMITKLTGNETRETILGYTQRGGAPSPMDRILATRYGAAAAQAIAECQFGKMVALKNNMIELIPLADVAGKTKTVPPDHPLIREGRLLDTCFGDRLP